MITFTLYALTVAILIGIGALIGRWIKATAGVGGALNAIEKFEKSMEIDNSKERNRRWIV